MKITILNGNPSAQDRKFDDYLDLLKAELDSRGHTTIILSLRDMDLRYCIGCFGCWVKTPGQCKVGDASLKIDSEVINSDFLLWASPLKMGFPSALLKKAVDKFIPLIHPYMEVVNYEAHHVPRYQKYPNLGLLLAKEEDTDERDLEIIADIFSRTSLNFKSHLSFAMTMDEPVLHIAQSIESARKLRVPYKKRLAPMLGVVIDPPTSLTIFNGSPRGNKGNTPIMLNKFAEGFASAGGNDFQIHTLNRINQREAHLQAFSEAECVFLGFPLYTDAMPGMVKDFIESLEPLKGRPDNPPIGFLVQSGFPEAAHSRHIERYLEKLAARLGSPYLGTIVRGNGEGTRIMPENMTKDLFSTLNALGAAFGARGKIAPELLKQLAKPERYSPLLTPVFKLFLKLPMANFHWNSQLKENGVFDDRFAKPFALKEN